MSLPFNLNSVLATASLVEGFDVVRNAFPVEGKYSKRVITYELLDEMMDNGYPQITEIKVLQEYIKTEANKSTKAS